MRNIDIDELKDIQCDILNKVHIFCINNGIKYSLAYGTLLGAIRHKGYIPWDDDIDIMMLRPDYEKFVKSFSGAYPELSICAPELNLDYYAPYANVWDNRTKLYEGSIETKYDRHRGFDIGVKIDIFPIDAVPDGSKRWLQFRYNFLEQLKRSFNPSSIDLDNMQRKGVIFKLGKNMISTIGHIIGYKSVQKKIIRMAKSSNFNKAKRVDMVVFDYRQRDFSKSSFDTLVNIQFEKYIFKSISNYDEFLSASYGNYMKLPPLEQQVAHHHFQAYWK
ncbi:MAG: LicD family protein [Alistipes sp.]|nr:LicD family protein [Alistipes sp.]